MSLKKYILKENKDVDIVENIKREIESRLHLNLDSISDEFELIDKGSFASVFTIKQYPRKIIRIEPDPFESFFIEVAGHDHLKHVVKVFYSDIITVKGMKIEITVMEKLQQVDKYLKQEMAYLEEYYGDIGNFVINENWRDMSEVDSDLEPLLKDLEAGIKELNDINVYLNDLHGGNVMYDPVKKRYKIIDLSNI